MKRYQLGILAILAMLVNTLSVAANEGYADLVAKTQSAVVNIQVEQRAVEQTRRMNPFDFFGAPPQRQQRQPRPQGAGTGFIISPDGYILTNRHVVADSERIEVLVEQKSFKGELVGVDDSLDVALIKIDADNLNFLKIGNSDAMRIGDIVLAMGYPLSLGFSVTTGIISGIGRDLRVESMDVARYIQTDADITFGNSGGPLINTKGEVIALNTLIVTRGETFGFSIPSNLLVNSVEQLKSFGEVRRGALGVSISDLNSEAADYFGIEHGALVGGVTKGLPAEKAGIKEDDVILALDGEKVTGANDVIATVSAKKPGDKIRVQVLSNGKKREKVIKLGNRSDLMDNGRPSRRGFEPEPDSSTESGLGFSVLPLNDRRRADLDLIRDAEGVLIDEVDPNSIAARKGLQPGTVLLKINNQSVSSLKEVRKITDPIEKGEAVALRVVEFARSFSGVNRNERTIFARKE